MSATNFNDGSFLTPNFMNTIYKNGGGHRHDGIDADGHAGQIDLGTDVINPLPTNLVPAIDLGSTGFGGTYNMLAADRVVGLVSGVVTLVGDQEVTGKKTMDYLYAGSSGSNPAARIQVGTVSAPGGSYAHATQFLPPDSMAGFGFHMWIMYQIAVGTSIILPNISTFDLFNTDLSVQWQGSPSPWRLKGAVSQHILNLAGYPEQKVYAVPYTNNHGVYTASGNDGLGYELTGAAVGANKLSISQSGSAWYINNAGPVACRVSGTFSVTSVF